MEQTFFDDGSVLMTYSRIVIGDQTYPLGGITSIRRATTPPNRMGAYHMVAFGVILIIPSFAAIIVSFVGIASGNPAQGIGFGIGLFFLGVFFLGLGVLIWRMSKPTYHIFLGTAGGERQALTSQDSDYVSR